MMEQEKVEQAITILEKAGMPRQQLNERSGLTLLALVNLKPSGTWQEIERPVMGVTPIMDWAREYYHKNYAPNTREAVRRQTLHQFVDAGLVLLNPDNPQWPINSPKTCYQVESEFYQLLMHFGKKNWKRKLVAYLSNQQTLKEQYAKARAMAKLPIRMKEAKEIIVSAGEHSQLIKEIIEEFAPRFVPGTELIYVGDTGAKFGYFDKDKLQELGVTVDSHGKMPDVVLYWAEKNWLVLVESVTSHGPVNAKRHGELAELFKTATAGLVYVTAFPNRKVMNKYLSEIAWETEVWVADAPTHMIHFNGERFLGPY